MKYPDIMTALIDPRLTSDYYNILDFYHHCKAGKITEVLRNIILEKVCGIKSFNW